MKRTVSDLHSKMFWISVQERQGNGERYGQAVFNSAYALFPNEVGNMVTTELDPFYNDSRVKQFLETLTNEIGE